MSKQKLTRAKSERLQAIFKQFDAVVDGIQEEIAKNDVNGLAWRRFLTRNINRHFPKKLAEARGAQSAQQDLKVSQEKSTKGVLNRHGIRLQVDTAQTIVAALSMRIDYLTGELHNKQSRMTNGEIMIAIHDCCRMAVLFGTEKRISCAPEGWFLSPDVLRQREQLIEDDDDAAEILGSDFIQVFGNKAGAARGKAK